jgi:hypothetical protein
MNNELTAAEHAVMNATENESLTLHEEGEKGTAEYLYGLSQERAWRNAGSYTDGTDVTVEQFRAAFKQLFGFSL